MVDEEKRTNEALDASKKYNTVVEEANDYIEHFDILETITNVGNDEVFTPRKTCDMMLDSLPDEVWHNPLYKWLNPATKNGIFEREIAIRLDKGLENVITDKEERRKHILQNMIFSIGQTKFTSNVARRTLYYCSQANRKCDGIKADDGHYVNGYSIGNGSWFDDEEGNIKTPCTDHEYVDSSGRKMPSTCKGDERKKYKCKYCGIAGDSKYNDANQREKYAYEFLHVNSGLSLSLHLIKRFFGGNKTMKFDIIIGNPPYQLSDGGHGASAMPIYQKFVQQAKSLSPKYMSFIIPSRWFTGGRGLDDFRLEMINDKHIVSLDDFPNGTDCFPTVEIKGGVCYFLWSKDYKGDPKITIHDGKKIIDSSIRPLVEPGLDIFIRDGRQINILRKIRKLKEPLFYDIMSANDPFGYDVRVENSMLRVKPKYELKPFPNSVKFYYFGWRENGVGYVAKDSVKKGQEYIGKYKIFIPRAWGTGITATDKLNCFIGEPDSVCTETYSVIGPLKSLDECNNIISYINTKFFHFVVSMVKITQAAAKHVYQLVPMQDFTESWNDEKLYKKYGFSSSEIEFIEKMIWNKE